VYGSLIRNMGGKKAENDVIRMWWMVTMVENLGVEGLKLTVVRASISRFVMWFEKTMFPEVATLNELEGLISNTFDTMSSTIMAGGYQSGGMEEQQDDDMGVDMEIGI